MNTIYRLPTQAHEDDFLKHAEKQGFWWGSGAKPTSKRYWKNCEQDFGCGQDYAILTRDSSFFKGCVSTFKGNNPDLPVVEWKIDFTKADMQIGQRFKMRNEAFGHWDSADSADYTDNLKWNVSRNSDYDIVEVYPFSNTPIWKREEPKYRVKTELTKEQAEKLGLDLCEVIE